MLVATTCLAAVWSKESFQYSQDTREDHQFLPSIVTLYDQVQLRCQADATQTLNSQVRDNFVSDFIDVSGRKRENSATEPRYSRLR